MWCSRPFVYPNQHLGLWVWVWVRVRGCGGRWHAIQSGAQLDHLACSRSVLDKLELTRVLVVECDLICKCFAHHQHLRCGVGGVDAAPTAQPQPHAATGAVAVAIVHTLLTGCAGLPGDCRREVSYGRCSCGNTFILWRHLKVGGCQKVWSELQWQCTAVSLAL